MENNNTESDKFEYGHLFIPLHKEDLIFIWLATIIHNVISWFCLLTWVAYFHYKEPNTKSLLNPNVRVPKKAIEIWVIILIFVEVIFLMVVHHPNNIAYFIAPYGLIDVLNPTTRELLAFKIFKDDEGRFIPVRSIPRWFIMIPISIFQVIICFAILFIEFGHQFEPSIKEPITALYQSIVTFTT